jgi:hypothetical protein
MVAKLKAAGWISDAIYTPKTVDKLGHVDFMWNDKGSMLAMTYKLGLKDHPFWRDASSLVETLNEQEEAFFHENFLSAVPDIPPKS